jgi:hypothetical protein
MNNDEAGHLSNIPNPKTTAAQLKYQEFKKRCEQDFEKLKEIALTILVWGPSPKRADPIAQLRLQIIDELGEMGHNALKSEDLVEFGSGFLLSEKTKELIEAKNADVIIILIEDSPGALAELHDFLSFSEIASKILLFIPERYKGGYSAEGAVKDLEDAYHGVIWYTNEDLASSSIKSLAIKRVEGLRRMRFLRLMSNV